MRKALLSSLNLIKLSHHRGTTARFPQKAKETRVYMPNFSLLSA